MSSNSAKPTEGGVSATGDFENPLLWPLWEVLKNQPDGWKVHTLAAHLTQQQVMPTLDDSEYKDLFKRNFLIMNALYQLQESLWPEQWLQVEAMNIVLFHTIPSHCAPQADDPLKAYYLDWQHYQAEEGEIRRLLDQFWTRYQGYLGHDSALELSTAQALALFELPEDASAATIRRQWRRLAMRWHPDRPNGDSERFRALCSAWQILRSHN
ncbi:MULTISPECIES: DNA-J related domain-containing protein [unclassified Vibrio]|uniref:DNA-J related domain-containing protein n=1 Tax=Vibrio sp. HB236076 TaxID=3232307 RepID=A0AB39HF74_9VIBR|nr:DNA-J related domain-containing protein [Vibrio sp. HB161653]MDP5252990.1 DNA-J related domain-containing protein [Vibrio sp. HB161653]